MSSDLPTLIKRLEAATVHLEQLAAKVSASSSSSSSSSAACNGPASNVCGGMAYIAPFQDFVAGAVATFVKNCEQIGGLVKDQGMMVKHAFEQQMNFLNFASTSAKPSSEVMQSAFKDTKDLIDQIVVVKDGNRSSPFFNHLSAVADGMAAMAWVLVEPKPVPYITEMKDSAQFYANRVIKDWKEKDKMHVEWANSLISMWNDLATYVKQYHTTGLVWNSKGSTATSAVATTLAAPKPVAAVATATTTPFKSSVADKPLGTGLFSELTKGENVTSGLKKVDKSQMTHKNPELRASSVVKASESKSSTSSPAQTATHINGPKQPPRIALEGNKWIVENHENNSNIVLDQMELKQTVYIYNCLNSTIQIKGKINFVTMDGCKKTALVVNNVVSSIDIVNCKSVQMQILGKCPTLAVDKTDGFALFLSKESLDISILSSKSSEMNVSLPGAKETDDYIEKPIPEQFKTIISPKGELVTSAVEHSG